MAKINNIEEQRKKIVEGLELAYKELIKFKKSKNSPLIVVRDGKIIELDPEKAEATVKYKYY